MLFITKDGSHSIFNAQYQTPYHSYLGAIEESKHVFIKNGIDAYFQNQELINVLEIGFGTGLNALLSMIHAEFNNYKIVYTAIEPYPLSIDIVKQLNYCKLLNISQNNLLKIHKNYTSGLFEIKHIRDELQNINLPNNFDVIYFDAFSPNTQKEMWSVDLFRQIFNSLNQNGFLVTYCAKGDVKRALKSAGFVVKALAGPPRKREMIKAFKLSMTL